MVSLLYIFMNVRTYEQNDVRALAALRKNAAPVKIAKNEFPLSVGVRKLCVSRMLMLEQEAVDYLSSTNHDTKHNIQHNLLVKQSSLESLVIIKLRNRQMIAVLNSDKNR